jgi:ABC-type Fe3+/spermidine/putrescine transport system ATPase subunit
MLELVGLTGYGQRKVSQLSGGQRQRVATIRALAVEPRVLLLDEPLGALDRLIRQRLQRELTQLLRRLSVTAILVTHDQQEAFTMADRVAVMHQGRLQQVGNPNELYATPQSEFVATFLGKGALLDAKVLEARPDHVDVQAHGGQFTCRGKAAPGAMVRVLIRPEQVFLVPQASHREPVWNVVDCLLESNGPVIVPNR